MSLHNNPKRAKSYSQKKEVIDELFRLWTQKENEDLRLTQMIVNATSTDPFYVEDFDLIEKIDQSTKKNRKYVTDQMVDGEVIPLEEGYILFHKPFEMTAEQAQKIIHDYEMKECGIGEDEGVTDPKDLNATLCSVYEDPDDPSMHRFEFQSTNGRHCWYILF